MFIHYNYLSSMLGEVCVCCFLFPLRTMYVFAMCTIHRIIRSGCGYTCKCSESVHALEEDVAVVWGPTSITRFFPPVRSCAIAK